MGRRAIQGESIPVLEGILAGGDHEPYLAVSDVGTLAYIRGTERIERLVLVDRKGEAVPLLAEHSLVHTPRFSPDGRQVAYDTQPDIWIYDIPRQIRTRLTVDGGTNPAWSPDGIRIAFASEQGIHWMPADGSSKAESLLSGDHSGTEPSWSTDGRFLAFTQTNLSTGRDIWVLPIGDEPVPFLETPSAERTPRFSPDGRWIAYQSDESGSNEIYVRPFPGPVGKWKISADGGTEPVWSPDGKEVFYRRGRDLMVVEVETGDTLSVGRPRPLFSRDYRLDNTGHPSYDVSPDKQSFVMIQESRDEPLTEIHIVLNWFEELERLVPTK